MTIDPSRCPLCGEENRCAQVATSQEAFLLETSPQMEDSRVVMTAEPSITHSSESGSDPSQTQKQQPSGQQSKVCASNPSCWCFTAAFPPELLERVPKAQRGSACICARCAAEASA